MPKIFRLSAERMDDIAPGYGSCIASDHITVGGASVGYMYREEPTSSMDSGWRFLSGLETQDFVDNPDNFGLHDVNTIANYDRDIVPLLESDVGTAWARTEEGAFEPEVSSGFDA